MTYSMDLRERVVAAVHKGDPIAVIARRFNIARPTVRDWYRRSLKNQLPPDVPGPKGPVKLTAADEALIRRMVKEQPGITLAELSKMLSVPVVQSTVWRAMQRMKMSLKKKPSSRQNKHASTS